MSTEKQIKHREKWGGQSPKMRRLAYMKRRFKAPPRCRECPALAHWTWADAGQVRRHFYCPAHLPAKARAALGNFNQILFEVAPFFDEGEQEDTSYP
jgi:hypothetical protein